MTSTSMTERKTPKSCQHAALDRQSSGAGPLGLTLVTGTPRQRGIAWMRRVTSTTSDTELETDGVDTRGEEWQDIRAGGDEPATGPASSSMDQCWEMMSLRGAGEGRGGGPETDTLPQKQGFPSSTSTFQKKINFRQKRKLRVSMIPFAPRPSALAHPSACSRGSSPSPQPARGHQTPGSSRLTAPSPGTHPASLTLSGTPLPAGLGAGPV